MDFLFIHANYPAQFKHLAPIVADSGNRVVFLTNRADAAKEPIPGIEIRNYSLHRNVHKETHHYLKSTEDAVLQGQAVLREINQLITEGFNPKFVITHAGNGLGLFVKDLLPNAVHIGYFEWYFDQRPPNILSQISI